MKYRKKPVVIEAFRFGHDPVPEWFAESGTAKVVQGQSHEYIVIRTLEGQMTADVGAWVIKGVKGELYPCQHEIFEATYEAAEED